MRLIGTISPQEKARDFSSFLEKEGIENSCDEKSSAKGSFDIWIKDEDQVEKAKHWLKEFQENPEDDFFRGHYQSMVQTNLQEKKEKKEEQFKEVNLRKTFATSRRPTSGKVTMVIMALCFILFIWSELSDSNSPRPAAAEADELFHVMPINHYLMFDYPAAKENLDKLLKHYTLDQLNNPHRISPEGRYLLRKQQTTRYWSGLYRVTLDKQKGKIKDSLFEAPMFEKIKQGQVWRFFTPVIMHGDLFHIFFNIIWLIILGNQMEHRLGWKRYLLFVVLTAVIPNTAQYLMGGFSFVGLSGVVCGMLGFVWSRQHLAPWEGYQLQRSTLVFITLFVLGVAGLQSISYVAEWYGQEAFSPGIANTAHIMGAVVGAALGRLKSFSWQMN